ncbi:MAG: Lrp/AsnC ligand binding domain-containing protein [Actinomycetota bacterium]|nr:Lrp/AsnC ligand binding domain-containing protein [Actinomycetota bacterium]
MITAYVLIQAEVGSSADVGAKIARIEGVKSADVVTGPYDVIAVVGAASMDELGKLVVAKIQVVDGVTRTLTCPVIRF